jgi:hypothetical protein
LFFIHKNLIIIIMIIENHGVPATIVSAEVLINSDLPTISDQKERVRVVRMANLSYKSGLEDIRLGGGDPDAPPLSSRIDRLRFGIGLSAAELSVNDISLGIDQATAALERIVASEGRIPQALIRRVSESPFDIQLLQAAARGQRRGR